MWAIAKQKLLLSALPSSAFVVTSFLFPAGKLNSDLHAICMEIHRNGLRKFIPKRKKKNGGKVVEEEVGK
jgi:hypothetical protein